MYTKKQVIERLYNVSNALHTINEDYKDGRIKTAIEELDSIWQEMKRQNQKHTEKAINIIMEKRITNPDYARSKRV